MSDWDRKMANIDKRLESISDDQLVGRAQTPATASAAADITRVRAETSTFGVFARLLLSVALGVAIVFWPYGSRCGAGLAAYLGAVTAVIASGVWSSVWTFRHRAGRAHALSLLLILWGILLGAQEVLPRVGYAIPTVQHPTAWYCQ